MLSNLTQALRNRRWISVYKVYKRLLFVILFNIIIYTDSNLLSIKSILKKFKEKISTCMYETGPTA